MNLLISFATSINLSLFADCHTLQQNDSKNARMSANRKSRPVTSGDEVRISHNHSQRIGGLPIHSPPIQSTPQTPPYNNTFTTQRNAQSNGNSRPTTRSSSANSYLRRNPGSIPIQQLIQEKRREQQVAQKNESERIALVLNEKQKHRMKTLVSLSNKQQKLHQMEKLAYQKHLEKNPALQNHRQHVQEAYEYKSFSKEQKYQKVVELPMIKTKLLIDTVEGTYNFAQQLKERERFSAYPAISEVEKRSLEKVVLDIGEPFLHFLCDNLNTYALSARNSDFYYDNESDFPDSITDRSNITYPNTPQNHIDGDIDEIETVDDTDDKKFESPDNNNIG
jgi:hypothetical protein